ncbi:MAG: hypothetical protein JHC82_16990 [Stenotrophomonas sp.]|nr:hypothetical protein [Stenotrophomonas sp.]
MRESSSERGRPASSWAARAQAWAQGRAVEDLPLIAPPADPTPREVYLLCIGAGKLRNPAAAIALQQRCDTH